MNCLFMEEGDWERMKPIWWLLIMAIGVAFYILGKLNVQVSNFKVFIFLCFIAVWVALFVFWVFFRRKTQA